METIRYLRALTRSWWLIVLTIVAGGAGGFLVYHQATPLYRSSVSMIVASRSPQADVVSAQALASQQAQALASIATTGPAVADALKAAKVSGNSTLEVSASSSDSNSFVSISVSDADARIAAAVAQAYPSTLPGSLKRLAGVNGTPYRLNILSSSGQASSPYAPDWKRDIGLGLLAGLVLGFALAVLRETLNRTVTDSVALRELTGLTVLGTVPRHSPKVLLPARSEPRSARAEAYRQIRTTLLSRATQRPLIVAVTSASLGEGKTSVACNVAAIFSRAGHRVALVDADMRRPRVATFFELSARPGLSDVLSGQVELGDAINGLDDGRLGVLTAGPVPADPAELLGSQPMVDVLHALASDYEFVFVDTPPVLPVTDALILAPLVDGMIIVAKLGGTTEDRITRALDAVERVNATIIGVVPNQASVGVDRDYGYGYRYTQSRGRGSRKNDGAPTPADPPHLPEVVPERHDAATLVEKYRSPAEPIEAEPAAELAEPEQASDPGPMSEPEPLPGPDVASEPGLTADHDRPAPADDDPMADYDQPSLDEVIPDDPTSPNGTALLLTDEPIEEEDGDGGYGEDGDGGYGEDGDDEDADDEDSDFGWDWESASSRYDPRRRRGRRR